MTKKILIVLLVLVPLLATGCFRHQHMVGSGPHLGLVETRQQWYALWGTARIGKDKDGGVMLENANGRITTEFSTLDVLINLFTGVGSFYRRTVTIEK